MKRRVPFLFIALVVFGSSIPVMAQEEGEGGTYGYSAIDYDPSSNQITAYSETDMDSELLPYYMPELTITVADNNNHNYNNTCSYSSDFSSYASYTCQFGAQPNLTYTISAGHWVKEQELYEDPPPGEQEYYDYVNYEEIAGQDGWGEMEFFGPGPSTPDYSPEIQLGATYDSASVSTPAVCGDVRDQIIAEYSTDHCAYRPQCSDFTSASTFGGWAFTYSQLTPDQSTGAGQYAVLQDWMLKPLSAMQYDYGGLSISSGYRNPAAEISAAQKNHTRPAMNSRHMAGDAADIRTNNNQGQWQTYHDHAKLYSACAEPSRYSSYSHLHVDWRTQGTGDFPSTSGGSCPAGW